MFERSLAYGMTYCGTANTSTSRYRAEQLKERKSVILTGKIQVVERKLAHSIHAKNINGVLRWNDKLNQLKAEFAAL